MVNQLGVLIGTVCDEGDVCRLDCYPHLYRLRRQGWEGLKVVCRAHSITTLALDISSQFTIPRQTKLLKAGSINGLSFRGTQSITLHVSSRGRRNHLRVR